MSQTQPFDRSGSTQLDCEKQHQRTIATENTESDACNATNSLLVTWEGEFDPSRPQNWPPVKKWTITIISSLGGLVCLMSSTMLAPALPNIAEDLYISEAKANMTLSIFVLAFAFGPLFLAPMAEVFGRRRTWLVCSTWYAVWNMVCGFANSEGLLLAARLLAGLGSSAEYAIGQPVLGDLWKPEQRGMSFAIATFLPLLGPALGPLLGGVIAGSIGWPWLFWVLSIFDAVLIIFAFFLFPETYSRLLLHRKTARLRKATGHEYHTNTTAHSQPLITKLKLALLRPARLMLHQPIIQFMSLLLALNYGTLYFVLTSFATVWTTKYNQKVSVSGLHYLALCIGYTLASQGGARITDKIWRHFKAKAGGETRPEYRIPLMIPGSLLIPTGLLFYGWSAQSHLRWPVVDTGAAIFGAGIILSTQAMQQYVMESFSEHVASAAAASQFLRSVCAFAFPLFAPRLYGELGYGWGNTTLALVYVALAVPGPVLLWFFGERLRGRGKVVE